MSKYKKFVFRKVTESEHALLPPPTNSFANLLLETPPPSYREFFEATMDEVDFSGTAMNLMVNQNMCLS